MNRVLAKKKFLSRVGAFLLSAVIIFAGLSSSGVSARSTGGQVVYVTGGIRDYGYTDLEYNYGKLLQYSLYFYDANMCGSDVGTASLHDWRGNCHTYDTTTYTRRDGVTVNVNATGGYHDAGDHVKFGLPEAYAAMVLETSYYSNKSAYNVASQSGHLRTIVNRFADYFKRCMVLDAAGNVEAFVCQVGDGNYDHSVWCSPESQEKGNRPVHFANSNAPSTDIVSLSAAALAIHSLNFGDQDSKNAAIKLFNFARNNNKAVNQTAGQFYQSSGWADDYCLAAVALYKATGDGGYLAEYEKYKNEEKAKNYYWALSWDNTAPLIAYFRNDAGSLKNAASVGYNYAGIGLWVLDDWGSLRYNTAIQYTGLLYDKISGTGTFRNDAENQMKFILGNNSQKQCFVVGYNAVSPQYPHHRAASGYSFNEFNQGTHPMKYNLLGALVGGPKRDGSYNDISTDYIYNEVAIDYNATLVAAAAALYDIHKGEGGQGIDGRYYTDKRYIDDKDIDKTKDGNPMFRLYNPNSGEHFYTASKDEGNHLVDVGWRYEGIAWYAAKKGDAVYRLYNKNAGDHHYTLSASERDMLIKAGWKYEGVGWYSDKAKKVPLYRLYNKNAIAGSHHYTTSKSESDMLVKAGWKYEGISWYGR